MNETRSRQFRLREMFMLVQCFPNIYNYYVVIQRSFVMRESQRVLRNEIFKINDKDSAIFLALHPRLR